MEKRSTRLGVIATVGGLLATITGVIVSIYQVGGWFIAFGISIGLLVGGLIAELMNPNSVSSKPVGKTTSERLAELREEKEALDRSILAASNKSSEAQAKARRSSASGKSTDTEVFENEVREWDLIVKQDGFKASRVANEIKDLRETLRTEVAAATKTRKKK